MCISIANAQLSITPMLGIHSIQKNQIQPTDSAHPDTLHTSSDIHEVYAIGEKITPRTAIELEYGQTQADTVIAEKKYDYRQQNYSVNAIFDAFVRGEETLSANRANAKYQPFILVGAGYKNVETKAKDALDHSRQVTHYDDTYILNLGYGFKYVLTDFSELRAEARVVHDFSDQSDDLLLLLGLTFYPFAHETGSRDANTLALPSEIGQSVMLSLPQESKHTDMLSLPSESKNTAEMFLPTEPKDVTEMSLPSLADGIPPSTVVTVPRVDGLTTLPKQKYMIQHTRMGVSVFFDTNKAIIQPIYLIEIEKAAEFLKAKPDAIARIEGHTDSQGSSQLNTRLSIARANAFKNTLVNRYGISPQRLETYGFASVEPVASNATEEGRQLNRRATAMIDTTQLAPVAESP